MRKHKRDIRSVIGFVAVDVMAALLIALKVLGDISWLWFSVLSLISIPMILAVIGFIVFLRLAAGIYRDDWMR